MATSTHQTPEWETPAPKPNLFSRFKNNTLFTPSSPSNPIEPSKPSKEIPSQTTDAETGSVKRAPSKAWLSRLGGSRKKTLFSIAAVIVVIILILGLALGLGLKDKSKKSQNLPLPSKTGIFTGDLTYYSPGPGYGACGYENTSSDNICAVSHLLWDAVSTSSNPNNNPLCGKKIRITRFDATAKGNRSQDVEVVDRCVGCQATDLDLSLSVFTGLADEALGRVAGSWAWLD